MRLGVLRFGALLLLVAMIGLARAAEPALQDPTRPPVSTGYAGEGGDLGGRLSSVILPRNGRPSAVIGGQVVLLGGFVGEARLVRVSENEVVLEGPDGIERLYLTPDVEKKVIKAAARQKKERP